MAVEETAAESSSSTGHRHASGKNRQSRSPAPGAGARKRNSDSSGGSSGSGDGRPKDKSKRKNNKTAVSATATTVPSSSSTQQPPPAVRRSANAEATQNPSPPPHSEKTATASLPASPSTTPTVANLNPAASAAHGHATSTSTTTTTTTTSAEGVSSRGDGAEKLSREADSDDNDDVSGGGDSPPSHRRGTVSQLLHSQHFTDQPLQPTTFPRHASLTSAAHNPLIDDLLGDLGSTTHQTISAGTDDASAPAVDSSQAPPPLPTYANAQKGPLPAGSPNRPGPKPRGGDRSRHRDSDDGGESCDSRGMLDTLIALSASAGDGGGSPKQWADGQERGVAPKGGNNKNSNGVGGVASTALDTVRTATQSFVHTLRMHDLSFFLHGEEASSSPAGGGNGNGTTTTTTGGIASCSNTRQCQRETKVKEQLRNKSQQEVDALVLDLLDILDEVRAGRRDSGQPLTGSMVALLSTNNNNCDGGGDGRRASGGYGGFGDSSVDQLGMSMHSTMSIASLMRPPVHETRKIHLRYDPLEKKKIINNYLILANLGRGSYGKVKLGENLTTRQKVAIKIIDKRFLQKKFGGLADRAAAASSDEEKGDDDDGGGGGAPRGKPSAAARPKSESSPMADNALRREIAIMKKVRHRNCVSLYEVIDDPSSQKLYLIMDYIPNGPVVRLAQSNIPLELIRRLEEEDDEGKSGVPVAATTTAAENCSGSGSSAAARDISYNSYLIRCCVRQQLLAARAASSPPSDLNSTTSPGSPGGSPLTRARVAAAASSDGVVAVDGVTPLSMSEMYGRSSSPVFPQGQLHLSVQTGLASPRGLPGGSDFYVFSCKPVKEEVVFLYLRQLVSGLRYLHKKNVVHHDIKPDNILLGINSRVYFTDFGVSEIFEKRPAKVRRGGGGGGGGGRRGGKAPQQQQQQRRRSSKGGDAIDDDADFSDGEDSSSNGNNSSKSAGPRFGAGTLLFTAPELFLTDSDAARRINPFATDVWALGVTIYCVLMGVSPFNGKSYQEISHNIKHVHFPFNGFNVESAPLSPSWETLFKGLLAKDPRRRWGLGTARNFLDSDPEMKKLNAKSVPYTFATPLPNATAAATTTTTTTATKTAAKPATTTTTAGGGGVVKGRADPLGTPTSTAPAASTSGSGSGTGTGTGGVTSSPSATGSGSDTRTGKATPPAARTKAAVQPPSALATGTTVASARSPTMPRGSRPTHVAFSSSEVQASRPAKKPRHFTAGSSSSHSSARSSGRSAPRASASSSSSCGDSMEDVPVVSDADRLRDVTAGELANAKRTERVEVLTVFQKQLVISSTTRAMVADYVARVRFRLNQRMKSNTRLVPVAQIVRRQQQQQQQQQEARRVSARSGGASGEFTEGAESRNFFGHRSSGLSLAGASSCSSAFHYCHQQQQQQASATTPATSAAAAAAAIASRHGASFSLSTTASARQRRHSGGGGGSPLTHRRRSAGIGSSSSSSSSSDSRDDDAYVSVLVDDGTVIVPGLSAASSFHRIEAGANVFYVPARSPVERSATGVVLGDSNLVSLSSLTGATRTAHGVSRQKGSVDHSAATSSTVPWSPVQPAPAGSSSNTFHSSPAPSSTAAALVAAATAAAAVAASGARTDGLRPEASIPTLHSATSTSPQMAIVPSVGGGVVSVSSVPVVQAGNGRLGVLVASGDGVAGRSAGGWSSPRTDSLCRMTPTSTAVNAPTPSASLRGRPTPPATTTTTTTTTPTLAPCCGGGAAALPPPPASFPPLEAAATTPALRELANMGLDELDAMLSIVDIETGSDHSCTFSFSSSIGASHLVAVGGEGTATAGSPNSRSPRAGRARGSASSTAPPPPAPPPPAAMATARGRDAPPQVSGGADRSPGGTSSSPPRPPSGETQQHTLSIHSGDGGGTVNSQSAAVLSLSTTASASGRAVDAATMHVIAAAAAAHPQQHLQLVPHPPSARPGGSAASSAPRSPAGVEAIASVGATVSSAYRSETASCGDGRDTATVQSTTDDDDDADRLTMCTRTLPYHRMAAAAGCAEPTTHSAPRPMPPPPQASQPLPLSVTDLHHSDGGRRSPSIRTLSAGAAGAERRAAAPPPPSAPPSSEGVSGGTDDTVSRRSAPATAHTCPPSHTSADDLRPAAAAALQLPPLSPLDDEHVAPVSPSVPFALTLTDTGRCSGSGRGRADGVPSSSSIAATLSGRSSFALTCGGSARDVGVGAADDISNSGEGTFIAAQRILSELVGNPRRGGGGGVVAQAPRAICGSSNDSEGHAASPGAGESAVSPSSSRPPLPPPRGLSGPTPAPRNSGSSTMQSSAMMDNSHTHNSSTANGMGDVVVRRVGKAPASRRTSAGVGRCNLLSPLPELVVDGGAGRRPSRQQQQKQRAAVDRTNSASSGEIASGKLLPTLTATPAAMGSSNSRRVEAPALSSWEEFSDGRYSRA